MAVKIRLKRMGKIRAPFYRVVVMDSRTKRDGRAIEEIGKYHPTEEPSLIDIDGERAQYWLGQGAQPTEAVAALLKITGDWQAAKGLEGAEGTLKVKVAKTPKKDLYEAALAAAGGSSVDADDATTDKRKKSAKKAAEPKAEAPTAAAPTDGDTAKAAEPKAEAPTAAAPTEGDAAKAAGSGDGDAAKAAPLAAPAEFEGSAPASEDGSAPEGFSIKGNKDSMMYHEPDGQWYDATIAEVWFKTADAAETAGFAKAGSSE